MGWRDEDQLTVAERFRRKSHRARRSSALHVALVIGIALYVFAVVM